MTFALETIVQPAGPTLAIAIDGTHIPLGLGDLHDVLQTWDASWPKIAAAARHTAAAITGARVIPQFGRTRKLICAGANYYKHLVEMDVPYTHDPSRPPFYFMKPPTALADPGRTVPVHPSITMLDWEVEMTAIIGRGGHDIPVARALEHVAGYTVAIDLTARDKLFNPDSIFKFDFLSGKGRDGFCPTASGMLPAAFLPDPQAAHLKLAVNGVTKQDESTSDMIYSVAELVSWISRVFTLEPGDVLLTGSPAGVGMPRREFLKPGDVIRSELVGLAPFECELYAAPAHA